MRSSFAECAALLQNARLSLQTIEIKRLSKAEHTSTIEMLRSTCVRKRAMCGSVDGPGSNDWPCLSQYATRDDAVPPLQADQWKPQRDVATVPYDTRSYTRHALTPSPRKVQLMSERPLPLRTT